MPTYAALILPAVNRVYADAAVHLTAGELAVFGERALGGRIGEIAETTIGGVPYVTFAAEPLSGDDVDVLSNLSSLYALFEVEGELLRPVPLRRLDGFSSDLLTIQKYSGKTNKHFTKLLLNVTAMAMAKPADFVGRRLSVLDPLCGRGTTLNQALMYGFDAAGVDLDGKDFDAYAHFLRTWVKNQRLKHTAELVTVRRNRASLGRRLSVTLGQTKEKYRAGDVLTVTAIHADTTKSADFFKPESFDLVVTDAPYGVQHGSRQAGALRRGPLDLLRAAIPVWTRLLRSGGAMGISWNTHVASREDLAGVLEANGLQVEDSEPYLGFRHRVDQAIIRDLIVARRP